MGKLDSYQRMMCRLFVNYPGRVFTTGLCVMFALCFIAGPAMEISPNSNYDWTVSSSSESKFEDLTNDLLRQMDPVSASKTERVAERSESYTESMLTIVYQNTEERGKETPVFTPESVQSICEIESLLFNLEEFHTTVCQVTTDPNQRMPETTGDCATPMMALTPRFYNWPPFGNSTTRECTLLSSNAVLAAETALLQSLSNPKSNAAFFLGSNVDIQNPTRTFRSRSYFGLGGPLKGFSSMEDRREKQKDIYKDVGAKWEQEMFDYFQMESTLIKSAYRTKAQVGTLDVKFLSLLFNNFEFDRVVNGDLLWTVASITFVFFYMAIHTESFFLASVGMMQILFSLPITYFFYRFVFQVPFYTQLHILTIFLVLGIGADDIFVLTDAWNEAGAHEEYNSHIFNRMLYAYKRAFGAIFNTSFTTAMAFLSTALSPIMPISSFGIYASIAVVVNYIYVVTFTPAALMLHEKYLAHRGFCGCCKKPNAVKRQFDPISKRDSLTVDLVHLQTQQSRRLSLSTKDQQLELKKEKTLVQNIFAGPYSNMISNKLTGGCVLLIFLVVMSQGVYFASQLSPPEKQEEWFTKDHMSTGFFDFVNAGYLAGPDNSYIKASFVWGAKDIDRSDFVHWYPADNRGTAIWKDDFDISTPEAQATILSACQKLREETCDLEGCMDSSNRLVRPGSVECWLEDFQSSNKDSNSDFETQLKAFRLANPQYANAIGFVDGKLKFVRIKFTLTLAKQQPFGITNPINIRSTSLIHQLNEQAPASLGDGFVEAGRWFAWTRTEEGLVNGLYMGFAICFPVAFLVLATATGNLLLAFYATITIIGIVGCVLGFCQSAMGWDLGIAESIAAVIVIGFSVDYVVHLGHMYEESSAITRAGRTQESAEKMGPTVLAGAITTLGAGAFMFGCQMVFFSKMAALITLTIILSLLFSLFFFMPLCALLGPEGETGQVRYLIPGLKKKQSTVVINQH